MVNEPRQRERSGDASGSQASPKRATRTRDASRLPTEPASRKVSPAGQPPAAVSGFVCPPCGRFIRTDLDGVLWQARCGSPPRFCSPGCRQAAYRRRQAGVAESVKLQLAGGRNRSLVGSVEAGGV